MSVSIICTQEEYYNLREKINSDQPVELYGKTFIVESIRVSPVYWDATRFEVSLGLTECKQEKEVNLPNEFYFKDKYEKYVYKAVLKNDGIEHYHISWKEDSSGTGTTYGVKYAKENIKSGDWIIVERTPEQIHAEEMLVHARAKLEAAQKDVEYWESKL